ncbi:peptidylprolyl isomerase [Yinghuangia sp. ASG 101]|uniref:peptidylprolyl isomerase n=1 Tax=Yinghuangia sp. ASG 101 TaxID=2896848 RepID=UPI001E49E82A|nr:peptidylprolyl isomerase [Yinghuangia sp. ASG 101]UGQ10665.1 peptidylprolyl isomerase [Yinghuangia sp. ASG 101]
MVSKEQRQRHLARAKHERQQRRRAEARTRAKQRNSLIAAVLAVVVVAGGGVWIASAVSGDDDKGGQDPTVNAADTAPPVNNAPKTCAAPEPGEPAAQSYPAEPAMAIDTNAAYEMVLRTTCGDITIALEAAKAPRTVNSFNFLAEQKYFDHTQCHRLTTEGIFVLQCGDPTATGNGGPGYQLPDENLGGASYPAGTVAMANSGPNTGGSQFFLVEKDSPLPSDYTPFGRITGGMDVLQKIAAAGTADMSSDGAPHENVVLNTVAVTKKT